MRRTTSHNITHSQSLFWAGQLLSPESPMYNMAFLFDLDNHIDIHVFKRAFQTLINKSDVLRSTFGSLDGQPRQNIYDEFEYEIEVLDFSKKENPNIILRNWTKEKVEKVFDISKCLFEVVLIKIQEEQWVWFFNQHHLITDAWAITRQIDTFWNIYDNLNTGKDIIDISLPDFSDYIQFENSNRSEKAINYWKEKNSRLPNPPDFFGRMNRSMDSRSERVVVILTKEKSKALRSIVHEKDLQTFSVDLSLFSVFSTLLFSLIHRLTGQDKIAIGVPMHNRTTAEFKNTLGLFIELFPLLVEVDFKDSFSSLFEKVRNENFELLKNAITGTSSSGLSRSYNVILNYINVAFSKPEERETKSTWVHPGHVDPGHHLRLQIFDFDGTGDIHLGFEMNENVFDEAQRKIIPQQFLKLLDGFLKDRFQAIGKPNLSSISDENPQSQNIEFEFDENSTVLNIIENKVKELPSQAIAIRYGENNLTFQELNNKANQLAHFLLQDNLKKNDRVAILLSRSSEFIISVLAILKAGSIFVPIPISYPEGRIQAIIEDASPRFIISNSICAKTLSSTLENLILLDKVSTFTQHQNVSSPVQSIDKSDLAYLLYTSGSTGRPKGVMISHYSLNHYIQWARQKYSLDFNPIIPLFTSVGFDLTITSIFLPLISGGEMIIYPEPENGPDLSLFQVLNDNKVNFIKLTPSHLALLLGQEFKDNLIKSMVVGGENFRTDLAIFVKNNFNQAIKIYNEYGPTEATVGCLVHEFDIEKDNSETSVSIGLPIINTKAFVLDKSQNEVSPGVAGELYISGNGLAQGYWKQDDETRKQFIANPFEKNSRLYRTGDLARWNPLRGYFEYLGRKDLQVKIKGHRIELAEIESVLNLHPTILQGIVTYSNGQLIAYYLASEKVEAVKLRNFLMVDLPDYMIPVQFIYLTKLPLTVNGKINLAALPQPESVRPELKTNYVDARNEFEEIIQQAWSEILQLDKIGVLDNYLELGGDSLQGIRVISRLNESFHLQLPVNLIFKKPTITQLADHIENLIATLLQQMEENQN